MYIYILNTGEVFKSDFFDEEIEFQECLFVGVGTLKEYAGGEWLEVPSL